MFKICGDTVRLYNEKDSLSIMEHIGFDPDDERLPPSNEFAGKTLSLEFDDKVVSGFFVYINHVVYYYHKPKEDLILRTLTYDMFGELYAGVDNSVDWGIYTRYDDNGYLYYVVVNEDVRVLYINKTTIVNMTDKELRIIFDGLLYEDNW